MPFVGDGEALHRMYVDLNAAADELGPPPWRAPCAGTPRMRVVLLHWLSRCATVPHLHPGERSGHRSTPWLQYDETLPLEEPKRVADRNDADPELRREARGGVACRPAATGDEDVELSHRSSATRSGHLEPHLWLTAVSWRRRPEMSTAAHADDRLMAEDHDPHVRLRGAASCRRILAQC